MNNPLPIQRIIAAQPMDFEAVLSRLERHEDEIQLMKAKKIERIYRKVVPLQLITWIIVLVGAIHEWTRYSYFSLPALTALLVFCVWSLIRSIRVRKQYEVKLIISDVMSS